MLINLKTKIYLENLFFEITFNLVNNSSFRTQVGLGMLVISEIDVALILTLTNSLSIFGSLYKSLRDKFFPFAFDVNKCATCKNMRISSRSLNCLLHNLRYSSCAPK